MRHNHDAIFGAELQVLPQTWAGAWCKNSSVHNLCGYAALRWEPRVKLGENNTGSDGFEVPNLTRTRIPLLGTATQRISPLPLPYVLLEYQAAWR
jgi:hypothetical protein